MLGAQRHIERTQIVFELFHGPRAERRVVVAILAQPASSMITDVPADFSPEHPVGPPRVHEDDRQQKKSPDQKESLRAGR